MTLEIWGRSSSINVQKVLWVCEELRLDFVRHDAGAELGQVDTLEYRRLNPNGLIPTIRDDGFVLWESNVILRYLATKYSAHTLFPKELHLRFEVERWMDWHATALWPALRPLFIQLIRTPPEQRNASIIANAHRDTERLFAILDQRLSEASHVAAEHFTIADIPLAIAAYRWTELAIHRPQLQHVARWYSRMQDRAGFSKFVAQPLR
jgi:glutathione S-transferase